MHQPFEYEKETLPSLDHDLFLINRAINSGLRWWKQCTGKFWFEPLFPEEALELLVIIESHCPFAEDDTKRINKWLQGVETLAEELLIQE